MNYVFLSSVDCPLSGFLSLGRDSGTPFSSCLEVHLSHLVLKLLKSLIFYVDFDHPPISQAIIFVHYIDYTTLLGLGEGEAVGTSDASIRHKCA